jgi:hypothetical protein
MGECVLPRRLRIDPRRRRDGLRDTILTQPKIRVYRTRRQTAELIIDWVLRCHRKSYEH